MTKRSYLTFASLLLGLLLSASMISAQDSPADPYHCSGDARCVDFREASSTLKTMEAAETADRKFVAGKGKKLMTRYMILDDADQYLEKYVRKHGATQEDFDALWLYLVHVTNAMGAEDIAQNSANWKRWKKDTLFTEENVIVTYFAAAADPAGLKSVCSRLNVYTKRFNDAEEDGRVLQEKGKDYALNPAEVWQAILAANLTANSKAPAAVPASAEAAVTTLQAKYCLFAAECHSPYYQPAVEKASVAAVAGAPAAGSKENAK